MGEKKYTKLGIFIFLLFIIVTAVFFASVIRLLDGLFSGINIKNSEIKCNGLAFEVIKESISYKEGKLMLEVKNLDYKTQITHIFLQGDHENEETKLEFEDAIGGGSSKFISLNNISIEKGFFIYPNDCKNNARYEEI